jgi:hypothetical protein
MWPSNFGILLSVENSKAVSYLYLILVEEDGPRMNLKDFKSLSFKDFPKKIKLRDNEQTYEIRNR